MPLVAGLGIGGIAVALAVQNLLGDLFASLSIALDKPFRVGDFPGDRRREGHGRADRHQEHAAALGHGRADRDVEWRHPEEPRCGTTASLRERRAELQLRIAYETPRPADRGDCRRSSRRRFAPRRTSRFERAHFARYGDYALLFEAVYFVQDSDYKVFMDTQQAINLRLLDEFARAASRLPIRPAGR